MLGNTPGPDVELTISHGLHCTNLVTATTQKQMCVDNLIYKKGHNRI